MPTSTPKITTIEIAVADQAVAFGPDANSKAVAWRVRPAEGGAATPGPVRWTAGGGQVAGAPIVADYDVLEAGQSFGVDQAVERPWSTIFFAVDAAGAVPCTVVVTEE